MRSPLEAKGERRSSEEAISYQAVSVTLSSHAE
jgi:hypothetical protein